MKPFAVCFNREDTVAQTSCLLFPFTLGFLFFMIVPWAFPLLFLLQI